MTPAACSPALPCCEGVRWDQPRDMARGDPGEILCSHECTPKGAAPSIPRAASAVGSAQVREEQARAVGHLKRCLGTHGPAPRGCVVQPLPLVLHLFSLLQ